MSDLISRNDIRYEKMLRPFGDGNYEYCDVAYRDEIEALPSVESELVRCKDCKWYDIAHPYGSDITYVFHCKINGRFFEALHYCGFGERRE